MPTFLTAEHDTSLPALMDWQDIEMDSGMLADMENILQFDLEAGSPVRFLGGFKVTNLVLADLCVNLCMPFILSLYLSVVHSRACVSLCFCERIKERFVTDHFGFSSEINYILTASMMSFL
jgi:hypothetical protein